METATLFSLKEREREINRRGFEHRVEAFLKRWAPDDLRDRAEFEMNLIVLVREIYVDAQQPVLDQLGKIVSLMPPFAIIQKKE